MQSVVSKEKFFEGRVYARTDDERTEDRRTHDGHNALTIAHWPLASGAKKDKLLVTSNFSFSHNIFYPIW